MAESYNPKNFVLIAGEAQDPEAQIPRVFSYYAEDDYVLDILNGPPPVPPVPAGSNFFGLRTNGSGSPLTQEEKLLPSAANQLCAGSGIMIYGPNQQGPGNPGFGKYYILYLRMTSLWGNDTSYAQVFYYAEP